MGNITSYRYNESAPHLESLISHIRYPDASQIQMDYDDLGCLTIYTDALGQKVTYHYDALGQLTHLSGHSVLDQNTKRTQRNATNNRINLPAIINISMTR